VHRDTQSNGKLPLVSDDGLFKWQRRLSDRFCPYSWARSSGGGYKLASNSSDFYGSAAVRDDDGLVGSGFRTSAPAAPPSVSFSKQHILSFLPLPHGQGWFHRR